MGEVIQFPAWDISRGEPCDTEPYWLTPTRHYAASCETCHHPKCRHAGFHFLACTAHTSNQTKKD